jgi:hypothetical protein
VASPPLGLTSAHRQALTSGSLCLSGPQQNTATRSQLPRSSCDDRDAVRTRVPLTGHLPSREGSAERVFQRFRIHLALSAILSDGLDEVENPAPKLTRLGRRRAAASCEPVIFPPLLCRSVQNSKTATGENDTEGKLPMGGGFPARSQK